jgi:hypothetical protein
MSQGDDFTSDELVGKLDLQCDTNNNYQETQSPAPGLITENSATSLKSGKKYKSKKISR